jgi:hypothetical protein
MYKIIEPYMQEELDNFFDKHEKSIKEKTKLLIDFNEIDDIEIEPSSKTFINALSIEPVLKQLKPEKSVGVKSEILDLKNKKNNKNKLF